MQATQQIYSVMNFLSLQYGPLHCRIYLAQAASTEATTDVCMGQGVLGVKIMAASGSAWHWWAVVPSHEHISG